MLEYQCVCGGRLFSCGGGEYICDSCELEWFRCELCDGTLHARKNGELILEPIYTGESIDKINF